jgi:hypothetical protein
VGGGRGLAEVDDDIVFLAMSLRNAGSGIAVLHGWRPAAVALREEDHAQPDEFRRQGRDLYVPAGDLSFWQGAIRESDDPLHGPLTEAVATGGIISVELLYSDHDGGQRMISRFALSLPPGDGAERLCTVNRHWNLDRADPR